MIKPTSLKPPTGPDAPWWICQELDDLWIAWFRLVIKGGKVRVAEARIFPNEPHQPRAGEWSGDPAVVARAGLTKKVLSRAQPHRWRAILDEHLEGFDELSAWVSESLDLPPREDAQTGSALGRPAHTPAFLAGVADVYERACDAGEPPVEAVAHAYGEHVAKVRGWIHKARRRGFLEPAGQQGAPGGRRTLKAIFELQKSGRQIRCAATTQAGNPCKRNAQPGKGTCAQHSKGRKAR